MLLKTKKGGGCKWRWLFRWEYLPRKFTRKLHDAINNTPGDKFLPLVKTRPVLVVAETMNKAGRIGAAYLAAEL